MRFAYRLADRQRILDVDDMLETISHDQFQNWMAYDHIEPFGEERGDLRTGIVASVIANCTPGVRRRYTPKDFMPDFRPRRRRMSGQEIAATMNAAAARTARMRKNGKK